LALRNKKFHFLRKFPPPVHLLTEPSSILMNAENDLSILTSFLRRMMPDVEGHDMGDPPADVSARLDAFAAGGADAKERASLAQLLKKHPEYLRYLGRAIRARTA